jgi:hypothetical protein
MVASKLLRHKSHAVLVVSAGVHSASSTASRAIHLVTGVLRELHGEAVAAQPQRLDTGVDERLGQLVALAGVRAGYRMSGIPMWTVANFRAARKSRQRL